MAIHLFYLMFQYNKNPEKSFLPKFWMGPMSQWENLSKAGVAWFMIRWYLARNLLSFFCLIIALVSVYIKIIN
jgi:1,4-dihydroxy-2-naphthoate octaprenyltransferase